MSEYRIIYRNENPRYQPGCPIQVAAVQVSQDICTSQCYLQMRIRNVSNLKIEHVSLEASMPSAEISGTPIKINALNANMEPGDEYVPSAVEIPAMQIKEIVVRVTLVDNQTDFPDAKPLAKQERLNLTEKAAEERKIQMLVEGVSEEKCVYAHEKHPDWWLCTCGAVNAKSNICHRCKAPLNRLGAWEDQLSLETQANQRAYNLAKERIESRKRSDVEAALEGFKALSIEQFKDSADQVNLAEKRLGEIAKRANTLKKQALLVCVSASLAAIASILIITMIIIPTKEREAENYAAYCTASAALERGDYQEAWEQFESLNGYKDSEIMAESAKDKAYQEGLGFLEDGDYDKAYDQFTILGDYSNAASRADEAKKLSNEHPFSKPVGELVEFGTFEQDGNASNGSEDIQWRILAREENRVLVLSDKVIDYRAYDSRKLPETTFHTSELYAYLNHDFRDAAFNESEKTFVDEITILSVSEAKEYLPSVDDRIAMPTSYASNLRKESWPNRTSFPAEMAWYVSTDSMEQGETRLATAGNNMGEADRRKEGMGWGKVSIFGAYEHGVRPAMWVKL